MGKVNTWLLAFGLISAFIIFQNCTGGNIGSSYFGLQNTNPTREYNQGGAVISMYRNGLFFHYNTVPGQIGSNAGSELRGESCSYSVLWLVSWGDSTIESAKKTSKISSVNSVEFSQLGILAGTIYHRFCTIVTGSAATDSAPKVIAPAARPAALPKR
ncbi:MAG: TRL-like family protein [Leptospira sp.]|nr:TRL-like family protein [Leptospira sp.]